jgi:hypothetical protein
LTFAGGDKLDVVSPNNLVEVNIRCTEPEEAERFDSYRAAYREARARALRIGAAVEIYFDGEGSFRLFRTDPLPLPPPPPTFERVFVVETPVVFKVELKRNRERQTVAAEVHCNDNRANVGLQDHGETLVFITEEFPDDDVSTGNAREAVVDAVAWIRAEHNFDFEIEDPFNVAREEDEPPADILTDDRRVEDRD